LLASTKKGTKPDFHGALGGEQAKELYQYVFLVLDVFTDNWGIDNDL